MHAGEDMINRSNAPKVTDRTEWLMRIAADFEPQEKMPTTIASRLLSQSVDCPKRARTWLVSTGVAALSVCAVSVALLALVVSRRPHIPVPIPAVRVAQGNTALNSETKSNFSKVEPIKRALVVIPPSHDISDLKTAQHKKPALLRKTTKRHLAGELRRWKSPKVKWQVATVRRFQTGLVAAGWIAQPDSEDGTIHVSPALVEIPIATTEEYAANSSGQKYRSKHTSYEEIH
jgi:hypothetical protein